MKALSDAADLKLTKEELPEGWIIALEGDVTADAATALTGLPAADAWPPAMLLDFSAVEYINSGGIAQLIALLRRARQQNCALRARGLSDHYRRVFRMVGLTEYIDVLP